MPNVNTKMAFAFASIAVLLGTTVLANSIATVNAQENQTQGNQTNQTTAAVTVTKIDVDPLMKALKDNYPKIGDAKDPKEVVRNMVAAGLLDDLEKFKAIQDLK